jgi:hypothetical protein
MGTVNKGGDAVAMSDSSLTAVRHRDEWAWAGNWAATATEDEQDGWAWGNRGEAGARRAYYVGGGHSTRGRSNNGGGRRRRSQRAVSGRGWGTGR